MSGGLERRRAPDGASGSVPGDEGALRTSWIIFYCALTIAGLFLFRGVPVLNVAFGFPFGAWIAMRSIGRPERETNPAVAGGSPSLNALRAALWWALVTAAMTVIFCWIELGAMLLSVHFRGAAGLESHLIPLLPPPDGGPLSRTLFFAIVTSPAVQVLTTAFGGLIAVLLRQNDAPGPTPKEEPQVDQEDSNVAYRANS